MGLPQASGETLALTPAFDDEIYEYTAQVPHNIALVTLHPVTDDAKATVTVNGRSPSTPVSLSVGENVITVVVTAENGYQRTYTVTVTRQASEQPGGQTIVPTATPTSAPVPTATATATPVPTATATPVPTATSTPAPTATPAPVPGIVSQYDSNGNGVIDGAECEGVIADYKAWIINTLELLKLREVWSCN